MFIKDDDIHAQGMTTKDFEASGVYGKARMFRPRKRNKKFKTIFSEIKNINEKLQKITH